MIDEMLAKRGLKFKDLTPKEQETLNVWMQSLNKNQLTVQTVREYTEKMRDSIAQALSEIDDAPTNWLSLLSLFLPFLGVIRKWYGDQKRIALTARLRNYVLLEAFLSSPEKAKQAMERAIEGLGKIKG